VAYLQPLDPVDGRRRYKLSAPEDGRDLGTFDVAHAEDVRAALARARQVQPGWAATPVSERADLMKRAVQVLLARQDEFMEVIRGETGRTEVETLFMEVFACCDTMNYYARRAHKVLADRTVGLHLLKTKRAEVVYQPLGVIGIITPWNGPFVLSLNPTVQAVLAGNCVLLKPSEVTPYSGQLVERLFREAGFPEGVVQVLLGDGETGAALLEAGVDKISFTGSVRTGRKIGEACGRNLIPCTLELGGKDPMIICADADLDRAAGGAVFGAFMNAGQFCSSTERVYVDRKVMAPFLDKVLTRVGALQLGRDLGPMIFDRQHAIIEAQLADAVAKGAKVLTGGKREGNFFQPTVVTEVTHDMTLMTEETFGPILPVMAFDTEEEAIRLSNDSIYGLGAAVFTRDAARGARIARQLHAGAICVNDSSVTYGVLEVPFGGRRSSGVGSVNGDDGLRRYCHPTPVLTDRLQLSEEHIWYPFTADKAQGLRRAVRMLWGTPLRWWM
jgi:acyl-CoA reductase-like NAD-dependent aldehyde dehydrogenase